MGTKAKSSLGRQGFAVSVVSKNKEGEDVGIDIKANERPIFLDN